MSSFSFTCGAQGHPAATKTPFLNLEIPIFLNPSRKKQFSSLSSPSPEYKGRTGGGPASPWWRLRLSRTSASLLWMAPTEAAAEGGAWKKPGYPGYTIWKHALLSSSHLCLLLNTTLLYLIIQVGALIWTGIIETKSYVHYFAQLVLLSFALAAMLLVSFPRRSTALSRTNKFLMY